MPSWRNAFPLTRKRNKFWIRRVALACCMCVWVLLTPRGCHSSYRDITCLHCVVNQVDDNKDGKIDGSEMKWGHKHIGPLTHPHYDFVVATKSWSSASQLFVHKLSCELLKIVAFFFWKTGDLRKIIGRSDLCMQFLFVRKGKWKPWKSGMK